MSALDESLRMRGPKRLMSDDELREKLREYEPRLNAGWGPQAPMIPEGDEPLDWVEHHMARAGLTPTPLWNEYRRNAAMARPVRACPVCGDYLMVNGFLVDHPPDKPCLRRRDLGWVRWIGPPINLSKTFQAHISEMTTTLQQDADGNWRVLLIEPRDEARNPKPLFRPWNGKEPKPAPRDFWAEVRQR